MPTSFILHLIFDQEVLRRSLFPLASPRALSSLYCGPLSSPPPRAIVLFGFSFYLFFSLCFRFLRFFFHRRKRGVHTSGCALPGYPLAYRVTLGVHNLISSSLVKTSLSLSPASPDREKPSDAAG